MDETGESADIESAIIHEDEITVSGVSLPWKESTPRQHSDYFASLYVVVLAVVAVGLFCSWAFVERRTETIFTAGMATFLLLSATGIWYWPIGSMGHIISVDERGMWIRHRGWPIFGRRVEFSRPKLLPADAIGEIKVVREKHLGQMELHSMNLTYRGHRIGLLRSNLHLDSMQAILIEQTKPELKRPWWLYRCEEAFELTEAVRQCRDQND